ncbi:MAG: hypothetical protein JSS04_01390 [Proteobacteria bacterium]|nr:hypothetical protein [Pseudomonadota bacterium]
MRRVVPFLLMLAVSACGTPMRWDKPGATEQMVAADTTACRRAAQVEANRYYPFYPWGWGGWGGWGWGHHGGLMWQMRADDERFLAENRLTAFCMRTKGYEQVPVQPQTQAPPPQQPPSPEPPLK